MNDPIPSSPDFDAFLEEATGKEKLRSDAVVARFMIEQRLQQALVEQEVPRVVDFDKETTDELQEEYFNERFDYMMSNPEEVLSRDQLNAVESSDDLERFAEVYANHQLQLRYSSEKATLNIVTMLIAAHDSAVAKNNKEYEREVNGLKKKLLARLIMNDGLSCDDPWYKFVETAVPGENLDEHKDASVLLEETERLANEQNRLKALGRYFEGVLEVPGIEEITRSPRDMVSPNQRISLEVYEKYLSRRHEGELVARVAWESRLGELAREYGLDDSQVTSLMTYYEEALPDLVSDLGF